jgi:hypothetical protein
MSKHVENLDTKKIRRVELVSFLMGFSQGAIIYIISSFFKLSTGSENIGIFYSVGYIVAFFILLNLYKAVKVLGKSAVFYFSILFKIFAIVFLMAFGPSWAAVFFLILYLIFGALEWATMDVILESFSVDQMSGRIRGKHLMILSGGVLLGPLATKYLLNGNDYTNLFLFLIIANCLILFISIIGIGNVNHNFNGKINVKKVIEKVLRRKDIFRIYWISFTLESFYALMVVYTPIYLVDIGFSWNDITTILFLMLLPFLLIQYPVGCLADKNLGEKKMIKASLLIMAFSSLLLYFINSKSLLLWAVILFVTRIGAAAVEVLRDSYFYKRIDGRDVDLINCFRTAMPLAFIVSTGISAIILYLFPLKTFFILVFLVVIVALYPAQKLKDGK